MVDAAQQPNFHGPRLRVPWAADPAAFSAAPASPPAAAPAAATDAAARDGDRGEHGFVAVPAIAIPATVGKLAHGTSRSPSPLQLLLAPPKHPVSNLRPLLGHWYPEPPAVMTQPSLPPS